MKLTENKLRNIIREELSRLTEELSGQRREEVADAVESALDKLGLSNKLKRNTAGGRSSGEIEYVNRSDDRGFFVREVGGAIEIAGRGRGMYDEGTMVQSLSPQKIADAIEEEPLRVKMRR